MKIEESKKKKSEQKNKLIRVLKVSFFILFFLFEN